MVSLGIDFGTSTTVAAGYFAGKPKVIKTAAGQEVMPSCVAFTPNGETLVGMHAKMRRVIDPTNALYSIKRILGLPWNQSQVKEYDSLYPFDLEKGADDYPRFVTRAGRFSATEVATLILRSVRDAPLLKDNGVGNVTLSVPATFNETQRAALTKAGADAGFANISILDEPCAAALAHLEGQTQEQTVVVYDLGGGTFDLTVVHWSGADAQVLGVGGDVYADYKILSAGGDSFLGGDDVDLSCARWVRQQVLEQHHWDISSSDTSFQKLLLSCESAKQMLSLKQSQVIDLAPIDEVLRDKKLELTRADLQKLCVDLVRRSFIICDETLAKAGVAASEVDTVILSGGGCHMPMIKEGVRRYFNKEPLAMADPDIAVAVGAALHAGRGAASE